MNLPTKLQYLVQKEMSSASDPSTNPLIKINAVLDTTTRKILEYKQLMKGLDGKKWIPEWVIPEDIMEEYNLKILI